MITSYISLAQSNSRAAFDRRFRLPYTEVVADLSLGLSAVFSMYYVLVLFHIVVCLFLVIVVLLQSGKAADLAGAFGGMGSQTAFGPRGSATILSKATTIAAAVFMVTSMALAILATRGSERSQTVFDRTPAQQQQKSTGVPQPAPAQKPPAPAGTPVGPGQPTQIPIQATPPAQGSAPASKAPAQAPAAGQTPAPTPAKK
jgi:preprotein translocase subunit SecG